MPIPENRLFQLVQQQIEAHFGRKIPMNKVGNGIAAVRIAPPESVLLKIKYSKEHLPGNLQQHVDRVAWFKFSEADFSNSAPPFLTLVQGDDESTLMYLTLPKQKLRQLITSNGTDFNMYTDFAKQGHVFASRGLSTEARLACARSRQYLTEHHPERDLTEWLGNWQQMGPLPVRAHGQ